MDQKFLLATKDHQIKLLSQLPSQFSQFSNENKLTEFQIHQSNDSNEFPIISATAPGVCMISSTNCTQLLRSDPFSANVPQVHFNDQNKPILTTDNGYIAEYTFNLQHKPIKSLPIQHTQIHLALNEILIGMKTNQSRIVNNDLSIIYLKEKYSLIKMFQNQLFGVDTDQLAQAPLMLQEMLKTRNQSFKKKDKRQGRTMKDTSDPLYFEMFEKLEKSIVQELQIESEKIQLEEDLVLQNKTFSDRQIILSEQQLTIMYAYKKKVISLNQLFEKCPNFTFITKKQFQELNSEGERQFSNQTHYFIPFDFCFNSPQIQNTVNNSILTVEKYSILTLMIPRSDPSTAKFVIISASMVNSKIHLSFIAQTETIMQKSALNSSKFSLVEDEQINKINDFFSNFTINTQRVLQLSNYTNFAPVLLSTNLNLLLCFDSKIIQFQLEVENFDSKISVNKIDFEHMLANIEKKPQIERRRILSRFPSEFRLILTEIIGMRKVLLFDQINDTRPPTTLRIQNKLEKLIFHSQQVSSIHFVVQTCRKIVFEEKYDKLDQSLGLSKSVRFAEFSLAKSIFHDQNDVQKKDNILFPTVSAFSLLSMQQIKSNQNLLKNAISSSVFAILKKKDKIMLISANFNDFAHIQSLLDKNQNISAKYVLRSFSKKTSYTYKEMSNKQLLIINFQNYLRNEVLLPMEVTNITSKDIEELINQIQSRSIIDFKNDSIWAHQINISDLKNSEKALLDHQKLLHSYKSANLSKQKDILLLIYFLGEINIYSKLNIDIKHIIRQYFDATSGVDAILQSLLENLYSKTNEVCEFESELSQNFELLKQKSVNSDTEFMKKQMNDKLSKFEAGMSNLSIQVNGDLIVLKTIQQLLQRNFNSSVYQNLAGNYIQSILRQRLENLEQLDIKDVFDHPNWIFAALPILQDILGNLLHHQINENTIMILDGFLFLNYLYCSQSANIQQFYEIRNKFFNQLQFNDEYALQICRVFARYHDFSMFARYASGLIDELTAKHLTQIIVFGDYTNLNSIVNGTENSMSSLENAMESLGINHSNAFKSEINEILEEIIREKDTFSQLENIDLLLPTLADNLNQRGKIANSVLIKTMLGQKMVNGAGFEKCLTAFQNKQ